MFKNKQYGKKDYTLLVIFILFVLGLLVSSSPIANFIYSVGMKAVNGIIMF